MLRARWTSKMLAVGPSRLTPCHLVSAWSTYWSQGAIGRVRRGKRHRQVPGHRSGNQPRQPINPSNSVPPPTGLTAFPHRVESPALFRQATIPVSDFDLHTRLTKRITSGFPDWNDGPGMSQRSRIRRQNANRKEPSARYGACTWWYRHRTLRVRDHEPGPGQGR